MSEPFIGIIRIFGFNYAPRGWAFCDGASVEIAQYTSLFSLISTIYGGDGRVTFLLPNMQERAPLGVGQGPGLHAYQVGQMGGMFTAPLQDDELPEHTHSVGGDKTNRGTIGAPGPDKRLGKAAYVYTSTATGQTPMSAEAVGATGQNIAHINVQPLLTHNFCIALEGLFPQRN